jgi:inorganic triphosphatase YgiF
VWVERKTYLVQQGNSRIEIALDQGRIETAEAGSKALPICEVELGGVCI